MKFRILALAIRSQLKNRTAFIINAACQKFNGWEDPLGKLRNAWNGIDPERPFDFIHFAATIDKLYEHEQRLGPIVLFFMILSNIVSLLGLHGLANFMADQKTKEIGIRKVMGATTVGSAFGKRSNCPHRQYQSNENAKV
ncbi:MAG: hypothetical protein AMS23_05275 [Bacteroides sp. SM1_62]|nr:MAG: hypothetical protein AMS26_04690 [Bacteroides sp. SM23_62]KPL24846.1 MAG: hypothetical protein AMS23_05275 [Bacteroides sp. SM1_62]